MQAIPPVKRYMTPFPYVTSPNSPLAQAQALMREHRMRHLPVVEDHKLVGILSDRDIKLLLGPDFQYPEPSTLVVLDACDTDPFAVDLNTPLDLVLREMAERHIGSAVVTRKGQVAGVFTATDACREFARMLNPDRGPDEAA